MTERPAALRAPTMLEVLPEQGRDHVLSAARVRQFARGDVLARHGDLATDLVIVEHGHLAVRMTTTAGDSVMLAVLGPGEIAGEMGLISTYATRSATLYAIDAVTARVFRKQDFDRLRRQHSEVNDFLLQLLAGRVDRLSRQLTEAHHLSGDIRLCRRLMELGRLFAGGTMPVVIPLTQDEIAQLVGATRPTTNLMLKRLEAEGIIKIRRAKIELHNITGLRGHAT